MGGSWRSAVPAALSTVAALLVAACTVAPVVVPSLYEGLEDSLLAGTRGQDLMSAALIPVAGWAAGATRRGSAAAPVVWMGALAFWTYGYALLSFSMLATWLFPVHIAVLGLSVHAMVLLGAGVDPARFAARLGSARRWPSICVLGGTVGLLAPAWLGLMAAGLRDGELPATASVFVLDLALVFPAMVTAIVGLVRRRAWAWPLAGSLVILTALMLGSLVLADGIAALTGATGDPWPLVVAFAVIATAAVATIAPILRALAR